jgi:MFS family permease
MGDDGKTHHPVLFAGLFVPLGVSSGYVGVTLGYLLAHAGVSTAAIGGMIAVSIGMATWQFACAPLIDGVFSYKGWYGASVILIGVLLGLAGLIKAAPGAVPMFTGLVVGLGALWCLASVAAAGLIARSTTVEEKGRAGGWSQAGYLGGSGLGGGGALWIATHAAPALAGLVAGAVCCACVLTLLALPEPEHGHRQARYLRTLAGLGAEVWGLLRARNGALACFLMLLPLGTAAAGNLFSAVAGDWSVPVATVALVTGGASGLISIPGSLIGGYVADRMDRKSLYLLGGALSAACAVAMALAARTPLTYVVFSLAYALIAGVIWGAWAAVVYEAAGAGAAATKGSLIASLTNAPIAAMIAVDGWAQSRWGSAAMLLVEAAVGVAAIVLFVAVRAATAPKVVGEAPAV